MICRPIRVCQVLLWVKNQFRTLHCGWSCSTFLCLERAHCHSFKKKYSRYLISPKLLEHILKNKFLHNENYAVNLYVPLPLLPSLSSFLVAFLFLISHLPMSHFIKFMQWLLLLIEVVCKNCTCFYTLFHIQLHSLI